MNIAIKKYGVVCFLLVLPVLMGGCLANQADLEVETKIIEIPGGTLPRLIFPDENLSVLTQEVKVSNITAN